MAKERSKQDQEQERTAAGGESSQERGVTRREAGPTMLASPFTCMRRFREDLDQLFVGFAPVSLQGGESRTAATTLGPGMLWVPAIEVLERDGQLVVRGDFPGMEKDQIDVAIDDGRLVISGERRQQEEERRGNVYRAERAYGRFCRAIPLPEGADPAQAKATFQNGMLEVTMPLPARPAAHKVEIREGNGSRAPQQSASAA